LTSATSLNNLWARALGGFSYHCEQDGYAGYRSQNGGLAVGIDRGFGGSLVVGDAISLTDGKTTFRDYRTGDSLKGQSYQTTVYALKDFGRWYAQGSLSGAIHKFSSTRETSLTGTAAADFHGSQLGAQLGVGMPFQLGRFSATPSASFNCSQLWTTDYTENGAGVMSLAVRSTNQSRARSILGGRLATSFDHSGVSITPFVNAYWQHEFTARTCDISAAFVGGGDEFTTPGQSLSRDSLNSGLGVSVAKGNFYAETCYAAEVSHSAIEHTIQAGVGLRF